MIFLRAVGSVFGGGEWDGDGVGDYGHGHGRRKTRAPVIIIISSSIVITTTHTHQHVLDGRPSASTFTMISHVFLCHEGFAVLFRFLTINYYFRPHNYASVLRYA